MHRAGSVSRRPRPRLTTRARTLLPCRRTRRKRIAAGGTYWGHPILFMLAMAILFGFIYTAPGVLASPHPVWSYVLIVGIFAEFVGLAMALSGLYETWHKNAPGRSLYPWVPRLWARLRRPRSQVVVQLHAADESGVAVGGTAHVGLAAGRAGIPTLQDQVDELRGMVDNLARRVQGHTEAITAEGAARAGAIEAVHREIADGDARVESRAVKLTVDGIPRAVTGLGVTILGVLLQALAQGLPS
jgi:hypothetical protein